MGRRSQLIWASLIAVVMLLGCAEKKPLKRSHLPLKQGTKIRFEGIKDAQCAIADVLRDAKTGGYVVICK